MPAVAHIIRRRHSRKRRREHEARRSNFWLGILVILPLLLSLLPLLAGLSLSIWLYLQAASHLPTPQASLMLDAAGAPTRFYDRSGQTEIHRVDFQLGDEERWLRLDALPAHAIEAFLLAEDGDFLSAPTGFDILGATLQIWQYISGLPVTPSQSLVGKLARETLLPMTRRSGLDPQLLEIALIAESQRLHSPETLLEWRLNSAFFGHEAYGIEAAARVYFGKSAEDLSLAEAALLAMAAQQTEINPFDAEQRSRERAADLLFELLNAGRIGKAQFDSAKASQPAILAPKRDDRSIAPDFISYARDQAAFILARHGEEGSQALIARGGLRIVTSLDLDLQRRSACLLQAHLGQLGAGCPELAQETSAESLASRPDSGALVLLDVGSGEILSMVGGANARQHQPAILLHPIVYMQAFLQRELTPASMVFDIPRAYPGAQAELIYSPSYADGAYRGPLNLRDAMAAHLLAPVAQAANDVSMREALGTAQALGFRGLDMEDAPLELLERGGQVSLLDSAYAYSVLASLGVMTGLPADGDRGRDPLAVLEIADSDGAILWSREGSPAQSWATQIIEPSLAYLVNDILADEDARRRVLEKPASQSSRTRIVASLAGSSADSRDSWRLAYSPGLVIAAHSGRDDAADESDGAGLLLSDAPGWQALIDYAHERRGTPPDKWQRPHDIEEFLVCEISGLLPATTNHCPTRRELMPAGASLRRDDMWQTLEINRATGLLATVNTPDELRVEAAYFMPPESIMDWWLENDRPLPPSSYSADGQSAASKALQIMQPADYAYVGSNVEIMAAVNREGAVSWRLDYGADVNPKSWQPVDDPLRSLPDGELAATWRTALLSGIHTLRLTVTFADGSQESDTRLLTFDNTPPVIRLRASEASAGQSTVALSAEVSDNLAIERVEFYRGDALAGVDFDWPHGLELDLGESSEVEIRAVAYDQVGNRAESRLLVTREPAG